MVSGPAVFWGCVSTASIGLCQNEWGGGVGVGGSGSNFFSLLYCLKRLNFLFLALAGRMGQEKHVGDLWLCPLPALVPASLPCLGLLGSFPGSAGMGGAREAKFKIQGSASFQ